MSISVTRLLVGVIYISAALILWLPVTNAATDAESGKASSSTILDDASCLACHGANQKQIKVPDPTEDGELRPMLMLDQEQILKGVHGEMTCVSCHTDIIDNKAPHAKTDTPKPNCATCHEQLWENVKQEGLVEVKTRLGLVVKNIEAYRESYHADLKKGKPKAYCDDCHDTHYFNVPPAGTTKRTEWHLTIPKVCGEQCHDDSLEEYEPSVHGKAVLQEHNLKAAV